MSQWRTQGKHTGIPWDIAPVPVRLSSHQRLETVIRIGLSPRELARHSTSGLTALLEIEDEQGTRWQMHDTVKSGVWEESVFLVPGDYWCSLAIRDRASGQYSFVRRRLHAQPLKPDPLPGSWTGLPKVEFVQSAAETPASWFLPEATGHLQLPLHTRQPVHLSVLLNATPTGRWAGSIAELRRQMTALIPALKVITGIRMDRGSMDVSLLDLIHNQIGFEQTDVHELDWNRVTQFFTAINPGIVDVDTLQHETRIHAFFHDALDRALHAGPPGTPSLVIVLSGPAFFQDSSAVSFADLPKDPAHRVFYIRYRPVPPEAFAPTRRSHAGRPIPPPQHPMFYYAIPVDDLERPLGAMDARIYDAISPEQFRRVLASILTAIARF